MLVKLETKSNRVKGISFHPTRPWVLASLHNGAVQLWDYKTKTLIDKFDEHDGPVRGVCFHSTQPLFVSGGDDYKIKVWNYKQRKCLFTLTGHADYIRTVEFHKEYPWILSASDDLTIRIWNWQSRSCIAILTGHNHYVMSASFHPKEDLIVSASLDQTVRVWDITGLRKKNVYSPTANNAFSEDRLPQNELFANPDAVVKFVLEGHDRGVNWAQFHPTAAMIISGADDRQVKIWRYNETKAWDSETFRGHTNNVSCCTFHPRMEVILSNSEDKTIRAWDMQKKSGVQIMRREQDRFWVVAAHPELNLFAAGHDGGMIVFKLDKERPPYCLHETECVFYVKEKYLRICEFSGSRDIPILTLKGKSSGSQSLSIFGGSSRIKSVAYSAADKAILVSYDQENSPYELYLTKPGQSADSSESKKGSYATSVCFVGGKRIATLEIAKGSTFNIVVRNLALEETKRCTLQPGQGWNGASIDYMWGTPIPGVVLLKGEDRVVLYDVQQRRTVSELVLQPVFDVKHIAWSHDHSYLALAGSDTILLVSKKLEPIGSLQEPSSKVKSIAWDETGVLLYSTNSHIKYCLPVNLNSTGSSAPLERGIVRTLDSVLYITAARGNKIFCLDRETKMRVIMVDNTEYTFKNALNKRQYNLVLKMVKEYNLMGDSIIAYLQNKGFPEVALYFVKDIGTKFNLAIECGNIEIALECAHKLDSQEYWNALGAEALKQGNHQILEMAYQRTKDYDRLSFLYLVTGNLDKLKKMQKIAEMRGDDASRFHNSLYLGDVHEQIKVLEKTGQLNLAYITAASHGLEEEKTTLAMRICNVDKPEDITADKLPKVTLQNPSLMMPPTPILRQFDSNWPLLNVSKGYFDGMSHASAAPAAPSTSKLTDEEQQELLNNPDSQWEDLEIPGETPVKKPQKDDDGEAVDVSDPAEEAKGEWDLELDPEVEQALAKTEKASKTATKSQIAVLPSVGPALSEIWTEGSTLPVDHFAAGQFDSAFAILRDTVGIVNFAPLKPLALSVFSAAKASLPVSANTDSILISLSRNVASATSLRDLLPSLPATLSLPYLIDGSLKEAFKLTTAGKFGDALTSFQTILHSILFLAAEPKDKTEIKNLLSVCREYILGLRLELYRKELASANGDVVRQAELAAYFTHCHLEQIHLLLSLRSAMNCFFKIKNYKSATNFAKRLLDLDPKEDVAQQAMKVLKFCEQNPDDAHAIKYNERNPFVVCGISMVPIYKGSASVQCPFCTTHFLPEHAKKLCPSCGLAEIGKSASGLQVFAVEQKKSGNKKKQQQDDEDGWD